MSIWRPPAERPKTLEILVFSQRRPRGRHPENHEKDTVNRKPWKTLRKPWFFACREIMQRIRLIGGSDAAAGSQRGTIEKPWESLGFATCASVASEASPGRHPGNHEKDTINRKPWETLCKPWFFACRKNMKRDRLIGLSGAAAGGAPAAVRRDHRRP